MNQRNLRNPTNGRQHGSWDSSGRDGTSNTFVNREQNGNSRSVTGNASRSEFCNASSANSHTNDLLRSAGQTSRDSTNENGRNTRENAPGKGCHFDSPNRRIGNGNNGANRDSGPGLDAAQAGAGPDDDRRDSSNCDQSHNSSINYTSHGNSNSSGFKHEFQVLYTHQKTKKKKSWKDGRLVLRSTRASLYEAVPIPGSAGGAIDSLDLTTKEARCLRDGYYDGELESEKFLIAVEGPWNAVGGGSGDNVHGTDHNNNPLWNDPTTQSTKQQLRQRDHLRQRRLPSSSMKKLLENKFRIPQKIIPLHPEEKRRREAMTGVGGSGGGRMMKRSRPLQPGELERRFYGDSRGTNRRCGNDDGGPGGGNISVFHGSEKRYDEKLHCRPNGREETDKYETNNAHQHDRADLLIRNRREFRCNDQQTSYGDGFPERRGAHREGRGNDSNRIRQTVENPDSRSRYDQYDRGDLPEYAREIEDSKNHVPSNWNASRNNDRFDSEKDSTGNSNTSQHAGSQNNIGRDFHGPSNFVSDGFDPSDLYGEEDEEFDECPANEDHERGGGGDASQEENQQANYCKNYSSIMNSRVQEHNYTTLPSQHDTPVSQTNAISHQAPPASSRYSSSKSQEYEKETEELLALFDNDSSQGPNHSNAQCRESVTEGVNQGDGRDHNSNRDGFENETSSQGVENDDSLSDSFIRSIREADEQDNDKCGRWESKFSSVNGGFGWEDSDDAGPTCGEDGDSSLDNHETDCTINKHLSGFSLPSPGESSTEDDDSDCD
ncbi:hypothetical protein ACHAXS_012905 [Conticribra weissflogii]